LRTFLILLLSIQRDLSSRSNSSFLPTMVPIILFINFKELTPPQSYAFTR
jgi:hypothetical protein